MDKMIIIWACVMVVTVIIEALTVQLLCIWFSLSSLVALVLALLGVSEWTQVIVFAVCTVVLLCLTRPIVKRFTKRSPSVPTNADRVLGMQAIVIREINNDSSEGQVKVLNQIWSARSQSGDILPVDTEVIVRSIDGVKLMVENLVE